jgi:hypothetical protein
MKDRYFEHNFSPAEEYKHILDSFDKVLNEIKDAYSPEQLMADMQKSYFGNIDEGIVAPSIWSMKHDWEGWLDTRFIGVNRVNHLGCTPPIWIWVAEFEHLEFHIKRERAVALLTDNFLLWNTRFKDASWNKEAPISVNIPVIYNLTDKKFTTSY